MFEVLSGIIRVGLRTDRVEERNDVEVAISLQG